MLRVRTTATSGHDAKQLTLWFCLGVPTGGRTNSTRVRSIAMQANIVICQGIYHEHAALWYFKAIVTCIITQLTVSLREPVWQTGLMLWNGNSLMMKIVERKEHLEWARIAKRFAHKLRYMDLLWTDQSICTNSYETMILLFVWNEYIFAMHLTKANTDLVHTDLLKLNQNKHTWAETIMWFDAELILHWNSMKKSKEHKLKFVAIRMEWLWNMQG